MANYVQYVTYMSTMGDLTALTVDIVSHTSKGTHSVLIMAGGSWSVCEVSQSFCS